MVIPAPEVRRIHVEPAALNEFPADYWDCFAIPAAGGSAEQWARLSLRGAQTAGGLFSRLVWQGLLGFELAAQDSPRTLAGWRVTDQTPSRLMLDAEGRLMAGRMVFEASAAEATWTTMLAFHNAFGCAVWNVASHVHRALVPKSLVGALNTLSRTNSPVR